MNVFIFFIDLSFYFVLFCYVFHTLILETNSHYINYTVYTSINSFKQFAYYWLLRF